jgi:7-keto-8-aminopelargonate synthetase-like enzyme
VVTESLFSMDGDVADVRATVALARAHGAMTIVDDAHAVGAWGPAGRGLAGAEPDVVVGTFGKALGGAGAFVAASEAVAELLWNKARPLVFSTAMPPVVAAAATAAVRLVQAADGDALRQKLYTLIEQAGLGETQIAPVHVGDDRRVMEATAQLLEIGIFAQGIRPPTVPVGTARLRVSITATHDSADISRLREAVARLAELGFVPRETKRHG